MKTKLFLTLIAVIFGFIKIIAQPQPVPNCHDFVSFQNQILCADSTTGTVNVHLTGPAPYSILWKNSNSLLIGKTEDTLFSFKKVGLNVDSIHIKTSAVAPYGPELIQNPGFEQNGQNWSTDYVQTSTYITDGNYAFLKDPAPLKGDWINDNGTHFSPHSGNVALWVNGSTQTERVIFQKMKVIPGATYIFSVWIFVINLKPVFNFKIGDSAFPYVVYDNSTRRKWVQFYSTYTAPKKLKSSDSVELSLIDNGYGTLNDFGLDDFSVKLASTCSFDTITQLVQSAPISFKVDSTSTCKGQLTGAINISNINGGIAPYQYNWLPNIAGNLQNLAQLDSGVYTLKVVDSIGCSKQREIRVDIDNFNIDSIHVSPIICHHQNDASAQVYCSGGAPQSYVWSNYDSTAFIQNLSAGNYEVIVKDSMCTQKYSCIIADNAIPIQPNLSQQNIACNKNGFACVHPTGAVPIKSIIWDTYETIDSIVVSTPGTYSCTITDEHNCKQVATANVVRVADLSAQIIHSSQDDGSTQFSANILPMNRNIIKWNWNFGNGNIDSTATPIQSFLDAGYYQVNLKILDNMGCSASAVAMIDVQGIFTFYIPTAFSPNNDGINESFGPIGANFNNQQFLFSIFDRNGQKVYETTDSYEKWNGYFFNYGNVACPNGIYIWRIHLVDIVQRMPHEFVGEVALVK